MTFALGMAAGALITFVVFSAFMAPKHWDWYHDLKHTKEQLRIRTEEREHYKQLVSPTQWGPPDEHEARIVKRVRLSPPADKGAIEHRFDDILDGGG